VSSSERATARLGGQLLQGAEPCLLSDIARTQPWLRNRVRGLRIHYGQLRDAIAALRRLPVRHRQGHKA
jgi:hypothetical protein